MMRDEDAADAMIVMMIFFLMILDTPQRYDEVKKYRY